MAKAARLRYMDRIEESGVVSLSMTDTASSLGRGLYKVRNRQPIRTQLTKCLEILSWQMNDLEIEHALFVSS